MKASAADFDRTAAADLLGRTALFAALAGCFRRPGSPDRALVSTLAGETPGPWRAALRALASRSVQGDEEYSRLIGGTGACADGEISYRPASPSGAVLGDLGAFYRAFGYSAADEKPDHISVELEFVSFLLAKEALARVSDHADLGDLVRGAREAFLRDHLGRWVGPFARALDERAPGGFHAAAAREAARTVGEEALGISLDIGEVPAAMDNAVPRFCGGCPGLEIGS